MDTESDTGVSDVDSVVSSVTAPLKPAFPPIKKEKLADSLNTNLVKNLEAVTGSSLQDTIKGLEAMSNAIIENPDLLDEAERADAMLIEAIKAKLEIIDLLW